MELGKADSGATEGTGRVGGVPDHVVRKFYYQLEDVKLTPFGPPERRGGVQAQAESFCGTANAS